MLLVGSTEQQIQLGVPLLVRMFVALRTLRTLTLMDAKLVLLTGASLLMGLKSRPHTRLESFMSVKILSTTLQIILFNITVMR